MNFVMFASSLKFTRVIEGFRATGSHGAVDGAD